AIEILLHTDLDILLYTDVGMDPLTQTLAYSRFAPLQVATWGHPSTTGSSMIDYFVTSENLEDVTSETHYTEKLLYLNNLGLDYERPQFHAATDVRSQLGLPADVRLYGCPQTLYKFHPQFDAILARILEEDPTSELVLIEGRVAEWTHRLRRRFRRTLPCGGRQVRFLAPLPRQDFMSLLATVDVLLDPPFFGGGNSSIEAVAVGTPVVTMEGPFLRSRITSALYRELHLEDLIAADDKAYCQQATRIARDFDYQAELRERILAAAGKWFVLTEGSRQFAAGLLEMVSESK
ncbi:MAG: hypothetical protein KDB22_03330, partial [Planctomycetales bacterium]|nr:hypothetical protein [Planctomycetales bacterium]